MKVYAIYAFGLSPSAAERLCHVDGLPALQTNIYWLRYGHWLWFSRWTGTYWAGRKLLTYRGQPEWDIRYEGAADCKPWGSILKFVYGAHEAEEPSYWTFCLFEGLGHRVGPYEIAV